jgi:hypothetical protein
MGFNRRKMEDQRREGHQSAPLTKTVGIVDVAAFAASPAAGPPVAAITPT